MIGSAISMAALVVRRRNLPQPIVVGARYFQWKSLDSIWRDFGDGLEWPAARRGGPDAPKYNGAAHSKPAGGDLERMTMRAPMRAVEG